MKMKDFAGNALPTATVNATQLCIRNITEA